MERVQNGQLDLDELDLMLIRELEKDARISFLALASRLGTSQPTAQRRFNRLVDSGIITIAGRPAYDALGYSTIVNMAINAPPGELNILTEQLSAINSIKYIWVTAGQYNIMVVAFYRNYEDYLTSFQEEFSGIPRNARINTMLTVKAVKTDLTDLYNDTAVISNSSTVITELDISVIKELEKFPRIPLTELAHEIGVSVPSARSSLRKLTSQGIIRIVATPVPSALGYTVLGIFFIQVHPSNLKALTDKFKLYPSVHGMAITIGAFNCLIWASFPDSDEMYDFMAHDLGNFPGVVHYESLWSLIFLKRSFNLMSKSKGRDANLATAHVLKEG